MTATDRPICIDYRMCRNT